MIAKTELEFYKNQGIRTKVEKGTFDDFPDDIREISMIIQGLIIHPAVFEMYEKLDFPKKRMREVDLHSIQESINRIREVENRPLVGRRKPQNRVANTCRQFAMFICSVLREKGVPARCRCGFSTYLENGWFEDHWICEYWNSNQKRWVMVDAEIDDAHVRQCKINLENINPADLPKEAFSPAGILWRLYRQGSVSGRLCGYSLQEGEYGAWYIRGNMLRDYFSLNKAEYLYSEINTIMDKKYEPDEKELELLDEISELTIGIDTRFEEFLDFQKGHIDLIPK